MPDLPQPNEKYRHRKGGLYRIVLCAERVEEEGGGWIVVYQNIQSQRVFSQSAARFGDGRFTREGE